MSAMTLAWEQAGSRVTEFSVNKPMTYKNSQLCDNNLSGASPL